ncbi:glycoside hydrolase family 28 protein [Mollicutes bacterium LVI A0039]|nr:glycoside hydrolase family 28 protein [Mollicutes bacterium LVI A0039]
MWKLKYNSGYSLFFENTSKLAYHRCKYNVYVDDNLYAQDLTTNTFSIYVTTNENIQVKVVAQNKDIEFCECINLKDDNYYLNVGSYLNHLADEDNHTAQIQGLISSAFDGSTLYFPAGTYNITSLFLKSNLKLVFELGAEFNILYDLKNIPVLPAVAESKDFSKREMISTWEGNPQECYSSIISGYNLENVEMIGKLKINGNASLDNWWDDVKVKKIAWRPKSVYFNNCNNVTIHGLEIYNSPSWSVHPFYCNNTQIYDMFIFNPSDSPNTDGINPESCDGIEINGCHFDVGDDCIAIKSGKIYSAKNHYKPCRDIKISNCKMEHGHGAIVLGSEISSGVKHLSIENCYFSNTDRGLRVKTRRGRGNLSVIDDISLENIEMVDVKAPFTINAYYNCDPDGNSEYVSSKSGFDDLTKLPTLGSFKFSDIKCSNVHQVICMAYGLIELPIESITIENSSFDFTSTPQSGYPLMMRDAEAITSQIYKFLNVKNVVINNNKYSNCLQQNQQFTNVENVKEQDNEYC